MFLDSSFADSLVTWALSKLYQELSLHSLPISHHPPWKTHCQLEETLTEQAFAEHLLPHFLITF